MTGLYPTFPSPYDIQYPSFPKGANEILTVLHATTPAHRL